MTKKKIVSLCLAAVLVVMAIAGATVAYFNDTKTETNTFTLGNVQIKLDETDITDTTKRTENGNDYGAMYPGRTVTKDPVVHNVGANSAYIRAKVTITGGVNMLPQLFQDMTFENGTTFDEMYFQYFTALVGELGEGWTFVGTDGSGADITFVFKYDNVLAKDTDTTPIFSSLTIPASYDGKDANGGYIAESVTNMTIVAEAMQVESFDTWEAAFTAFDGQ